MPSFRSMRSAGLTVCATVGLFLNAGAPVFAQYTPAMSNPSVTLAATCNLSAPIATLHVLARNGSPTPMAAQAVAVFDTPHALSGSATTGALPAGGTQALDIPLILATAPAQTPTGPNGLPGHHVFTVIAAGSQAGRPGTALNVPYDIPAAFCAAAIAAKTGAPPAGSMQTVQSTRVGALFGRTPALAATPTSKPLSAQAVVPAAQLAITKPIDVSMTATLKGPAEKLLEISPPHLMHAISGATECAGHWATPHAFSTDCANMIAAGDLVLIWDAPTTPPANGYRLYATDANGVGTTVVQTIPDAKQTLADLPHLPNGFNGNCYALTAVSGARESSRTFRYCAGADTIASRTTLNAQYVRSFQRNRKKDGATALIIPTIFDTSDRVVGYQYAETKAILGDSYNNTLRRVGFAFDMTPFVHKRLVSAKLRVTIASSVGSGNNHSCANQIGTGGEFWWRPDAADWPDSAVFTGTMGDTGPTITTEVTTIVNAWFQGAPNYGFMLRNTYEDTGAFINATCETAFANPQLDLVYY